MNFCNCGGIFVPKQGRFICRVCGTENRSKIDIKLTTNEKAEDIVVLEENKVDLPITERTCSSCNNKKAYWWLIQTRSSDEPPTQFFRCTDCKHTWREYK